MIICQPSKRTILIGVCGRYQTGRQNRKSRTDLEDSHERRWFGRTNIIPGPCLFFGLHSKRMREPEKKPHGKFDAETISSWSYDMEGHAKKCVERFCELANKATQLYKVATPCMYDHQFKEEENETVGEMYTVCSQNCSEMSVSGS